MSPQMIRERQIVEAINKLSSQLDYHCKDCPAAEHTDLLQDAIDDLRAQLDELLNQRAIYQE
ncbi:MAG: hypothetical protein QNJ69_02790 [Gammaproteobacteria bacterium]|nr:hypothetical protein [Gammaproteobacteria bacterium]